MQAIIISITIIPFSKNMWVPMYVMGIHSSWGMVATSCNFDKLREKKDFFPKMSLIYFCSTLFETLKNNGL